MCVLRASIGFKPGVLCASMSLTPVSIAMARVHGKFTPRPGGPISGSQRTRASVCYGLLRLTPRTG